MRKKYEDLEIRILTLESEIKKLKCNHGKVDGIPINITRGRYMVQDNPNIPIPDPVPTKRAWCDAKDHVLVRIGNSEHGYDTLTALSLLRDLESAIRESI